MAVERTLGNGLVHLIELPWAAIVNGNTYGGIEDLLKGSGKFDEGRPISFLDDGQVTIGDTTYQRMD